MNPSLRSVGELSRQNASYLLIWISAFLFAASLWTPARAAGASEGVLYSFQGGSDGAFPRGPLVSDPQGNLYGVTDTGGSTNCTEGCGTVFELSPPSHAGGPWTETVLYRFLGGTDGAAPQAGLIRYSAGNLYGTTQGGGNEGNDGIVFELSPPSQPGGSWTETVIYHFQGGTDGEYPLARLTFDRAGNLYGTTVFGGFNNAGIVFQLSPPALPGTEWTETVLHRFGHSNDGLDPESPVVLDANGAVYSTTRSGVVFQLQPPVHGHTQWTERVLQVFGGGGDSPNQPCGIILRGTNVIFGTSALGGSSANSGTVFQLTRASGNGMWTATTLHSFTGGSDGMLPCATLVRDRAGNLYGTSGGNGQQNFGTVYRLTPPASPGDSWTFTTLYRFTGGSDGEGPTDGVIFADGGALYGVTGAGGAFNQGTVFKVVP